MSIGFGLKCCDVAPEYWRILISPFYSHTSSLTSGGLHFAQFPDSLLTSTGTPVISSVGLVLSRSGSDWTLSWSGQHFDVAGSSVFTPDFSTGRVDQRVEIQGSGCTLMVVWLTISAAEGEDDYLKGPTDDNFSYSHFRAGGPTLNNIQIHPGSRDYLKVVGHESGPLVSAAGDPQAWDLFNDIEAGGDSGTPFSGPSNTYFLFSAEPYVWGINSAPYSQGRLWTYDPRHPFCCYWWDATYTIDGFVRTGPAIGQSVYGAAPSEVVSPATEAAIIAHGMNNRGSSFSLFQTNAEVGWSAESIGKLFRFSRESPPSLDYIEDPQVNFFIQGTYDGAGFGGDPYVANLTATKVNDFNYTLTGSFFLGAEDTGITVNASVTFMEGSFVHTP